MTREEAKEWLSILQAYAEGKTIQDYYKGKWKDIDEFSLRLSETFGPGGYRIKPSPSYRPFKDGEELTAEFCKRFGVERKAHEMPFIWVRMKGTKFNTCVLIVEMDDKGVARFESTIEWQDLMNGYTFLDGSPCGVEEAGE